MPPKKAEAIVVYHGTGWEYEGWPDAQTSIDGIAGVYTTQDLAEAWDYTSAGAGGGKPDYLSMDDALDGLGQGRPRVAVARIKVSDIEDLQHLEDEDDDDAIYQASISDSIAVALPGLRDGATLEEREIIIRKPRLVNWDGWLYEDSPFVQEALAKRERVREEYRKAEERKRNERNRRERVEMPPEYDLEQAQTQAELDNAFSKAFLKAKTRSDEQVIEDAYRNAQTRIKAAQPAHRKTVGRQHKAIGYDMEEAEMRKELKAARIKPPRRRR